MMHTATIKIKVVLGEPSPPPPPPPPPFVGTCIGLRFDDPASLDWGIFAAGPVPETPTEIDWGDGTTESVPSISQLVHTYPSIGEYEVRLSDTVTALRLSNISGAFADYAKRIVSFITNSVNLNSIGALCFNGVSGLETVDLRKGNVTTLNTRCFDGCVSLSGRLDLPKVNSIFSTAFRGCVNISELHFAKSNEAIITALSSYDTLFGAVNARPFFDL